MGLMGTFSRGAYKCMKSGAGKLLRTTDRFQPGITLRTCPQENNECLEYAHSALTFKDFVPRLELLTLFRDFLGIFGKA